MAFTPLGHALALGGGGSTTLPAQNTVGAKLIVITLTYSGSGAVPTDNQGNVWTLGPTYQVSGSSNSIALFYCINPITSAAHTFTIAQNVSSIGASWWNATSTILRSNQSSSATGSPGSITPQAASALIISACSVGGGAGAVASAVNAGLTILDAQANNGVAFGLSHASLIQGAAAAVNVTWTGTGGFASAIISFIEPQPLQGSASLSFSAVVNLGVGSASFAALSNVQLFSVADLTPGFRPPSFLLPSGYETLEDNAGATVPGGLVWTYAAGTSTPIVTYTDTTLTVVNTNPIVCDAAGRWAAWVPIGTAYKLVFEGPAIPPLHGPVIRTVDGLQVLSLPTWAGNPFNVANYTALGGGSWTVDPGDQLAYQFMLDGKRLILNLAITNTSITGAVSAVKIALPAGIVSAAWTQVGPALIFDNSNSVGTLGYWQVDPSTAAIYFGRADRANLAVSVNTTWIWFSGVIAIT